MKIKSIISTTILFLALFMITNPVYATTQTEVSSSDYLNQIEVEKKVREYFSDVPDMVEIARCESKFRQYTDSGTVLRGGANGEMIGVFQFYGPAHTVAAKALGFDITTLDGNLSYAKQVYETQGTTPWESVRYCWKKTVPATTTLSQPTITELKAKIKQLEQLIKILKQLQELQMMHLK